MNRQDFDFLSEKFTEYQLRTLLSDTAYCCFQIMKNKQILSTQSDGVSVKFFYKTDFGIAIPVQKSGMVIRGKFFSFLEPQDYNLWYI